MLIDRYNADLSALTQLCEEMKKLYSTVLVSVLPSQGVRDVRWFGSMNWFSDVYGAKLLFDQHKHPTLFEHPSSRRLLLLSVQLHHSDIAVWEL